MLPPFPVYNSHRKTFQDLDTFNILEFHCDPGITFITSLNDFQGLHIGIYCTTLATEGLLNHRGQFHNRVLSYFFTFLWNPLKHKSQNHVGDISKFAYTKGLCPLLSALILIGISFPLQQLCRNSQFLRYFLFTVVRLAGQGLVLKVILPSFHLESIILSLSAQALAKH